MKYTLLLLIALSSTMFMSSCTEDGEQRLEIPITLSNFTVNALDPNESWKTFSTELVTSELSTALADFGYSLDNIKKVEPKNISLTITSAGDSFDNILYMDAYVFADGVDDIKVAYSETIPAGATTLALSSQFSDITEAIKKSEFTFFVRAFNSGAFGPVDGSITFTVDVIVEK